MEFMTDEGFEKGLNVLKMFQIDGLVVIGGDGSFKGAKRLANAGIPTMGIPGTIDNDLEYTDYTVGFDTALNTVVNAISNIRDTSSSHGRVNIIEVMGRHCGDIALHAGLSGGAESIIIPEIKNSVESTCKKILEGKNRGKLHSIVILAEGVGKPYDLADLILKNTGMETRVSVMGHLQRGGTPSAFDRLLASRFGARAVELLIEGKKGRAIGISGNKIIDMDINEALDLEKTVDEDLYELARVLSI
jgi:6-phosphofructokinase 1